MRKLAIGQFIPPILRDLILKAAGKNTVSWNGAFESWEEAQQQCSGYDQDNILEKCANAIKLIKAGKAVYERDSVIFEKKEYSWPLIAGLLKASAANKNKLCVLDFGGSLGSTYYQCREMLNSVEQLDWCIIEQENFVSKGQSEFETNELHFLPNFDSCLEKYNPNVIILSSVLQYLSEPNRWIEKLLSLNIEYIVIDRNAFIEDDTSVIFKQTVPDDIYAASYPMWFFNKKQFLENFIPKYFLIAEFDSYCDMPLIVSGKQAFWQGFILKKNNDL